MDDPGTDSHPLLDPAQLDTPQNAQLLTKWAQFHEEAHRQQRLLTTALLGVLDLVDKSQIQQQDNHKAIVALQREVAQLQAGQATQQAEIATLQPLSTANGESETP